MVLNALAAMTLTVGRRVILVEGVERWRHADVEKHLAAMGVMALFPPSRCSRAGKERSHEGYRVGPRGGPARRRPGARPDDRPALGSWAGGRRAARLNLHSRRRGWALHGGSGGRAPAAAAAGAGEACAEHRLQRCSSGLLQETVRTAGDGRGHRQRGRQVCGVAGVLAGGCADRRRRRRGHCLLSRLRQQGERLSGLII